MSNGGTDLPDFNALVEQAAEALSDPARLARLERAMGNAHAYGAVAAHGAIAAAVAKNADDPLGLTVKVEGAARGLLGWALAHMVAHMLGIEVPPDALRGAFADGPGSVIGKALGDTIMSGIAGPDAEIVPGDEGAKRLIGMVSQLTLTSWFEGLLAEESLSFGGLLHPLEAIGNLGHTLVDHLGLNRLMRVALRPLVDETISTPLRWKINNVYKPSRLGASQIIRQLARKRLDHDGAFAELEREGWTDVRIEAMLNEAARFMSLSESMLLVRRGEWTEDQVVTDLGNQGYEEGVAKGIIAAYKEARLVAIEDDILTAAKTAYAAKDIDEPAFRKALSIFVTDQDELQAQLDVGGYLRENKRKHLTKAEIEDAVIVGILDIVDYRLWLIREGYPDDEQLTLELLLQHKRNAKLDLAHAKAVLLEARATAKADALAAKVARQAALDAKRALQRQGSLTELRHAVIIGTIPESRYVQVLQQDYDPDTVQILVDVVEADRQHYLDQQAKAAEAAKRAAAKNIDIRLREAAVLQGVLSVADFAKQLTDEAIDPTDIQILVATLQGKLDDRQKAQQLHADAQLKAQAKKVSLATWETLVRRGHRTLDEYRALLTSLGYDDGQVAALVDLLSIKIADDQHAAAIRAAAAAKATTKGLTLDEMRRAVILKVKTRNDYQQYLIDQKFSADDQIVLLAELDDAVATAEAARQKRARTGAAPGSPSLPISVLAHAARLGLVRPAVYQAALVAAGYSADDVALDLDLLTTEIAATQRARTTRTTLGAASPDKGLSLDQVRTAVLKGIQPIGAYQTKAEQLGYAPDAVQTLLGVLSDELAAQADVDAVAARAQTALHAVGLSLQTLEAAVRAGTSSGATFRATLTAAGVDPTEADLLAGALADDIMRAPAAA